MSCLQASAPATTAARCTSLADKLVVKFCGVFHFAFPAKAGPTMSTRSINGTGFSREEAGARTLVVIALSPIRLEKQRYHFPHMVLGGLLIRQFAGADQ